MKNIVFFVFYSTSVGSMEDETLTFFKNLKYKNVPYTIILDIFTLFTNLQIVIIHAKFCKESHFEKRIELWSNIIDTYIIYNSYVTSIEKIVNELYEDIYNFDMYIKKILLCNCNQDLFFSTETLTMKLLLEKSYANVYENIIKEIKEDIIIC